MDDRISELPDDILCDMLTTLSMKDLLKSSILSKRWSKLWGSRRDLYFDVFNVFGSSEKELQKTGYLIDVTSRFSVDRCIDLYKTKDEFVKRVDQFVKNFPGTVINSFLVSFYLNCEQSNTIDQWISFAIAKGVGMIDLLFLGEPYPAHPNPHPDPSKRYKFAFDLFSETTASALKHLRLECCIVCNPTNCDFIPFKNLTYLSLNEVKVDEMFIESLLSNCGLLEELCLVYF
ncbi:F-box/FBD/LRR-repeat protein At1g13570 [Medicago truncatula]|uniref:F-box/FBD/LRR-repeat protein At1g13570 n=1 Tax=Medicago truncatula TaxID=3880 RepID=UPI000D2F3E67|nr:F-box/FBD/LRR-repeat protein At1g13570 [Medicago truncatula]